MLRNVIQRNGVRIGHDLARKQLVLPTVKKLSIDTILTLTGSIEPYSHLVGPQMEKGLLRNVIQQCIFSVHPSNQAHSYQNTYSQRSHDKIYSINQKIPVYRGDNGLKIHQKSKYVNNVMSSNSDKATWNVRVFDKIN